jgi:hypothetical protein
MSDKAFVRRHLSDDKRPRYVCERRARRRLLCSDLVQVSWSAADNARSCEVVILENLAETGAGLFAGVPIPIGTNVQLLLGEDRFEGCVRTCLFRQNGYLIGVELTHCFQPTKRPEHLLDVELLDLGR